MKNASFLKDKKNEQGIVAVLVPILLLFVLIPVGALAVDLAFLYVARNQLQNAADAGALAGARNLYSQDGQTINVEASQIAYDVAKSNNSMGQSVDINWENSNNSDPDTPSENWYDIERGHWSFAESEFTPNDSLEPVELWNVSDADLDANTDFINAVRVVTRREATPVAAFFSNIFGNDGYTVKAEAVAYIGFAGRIYPEEVDQPIAICNTSLTDPDTGDYTCTYGRMLHSGTGDGGETGAWTDFNQEYNPCQGGTDANTLKDLYEDEYGQGICSGLNTNTIMYGWDTATTHGVTTSVYKKFLECWDKHIEENDYTPWNLTLLVIDCEDGFPTTCAETIGSVNVNVVWVTREGSDPQFKEVPTEMGGFEELEDNWSNSDPDGEVRWNSFVTHFNLQDAIYQHKSIYFLPDCNYHEPKGSSGGKNFGVLARIPVLVK